MESENANQVAGAGSSRRVGSGRVRVRRIRASLSRSMISLKAAAPPATRAVPTMVWKSTAGSIRSAARKKPAPVDATTRRFSRGLARATKSEAFAVVPGQGSEETAGRGLSDIGVLMRWRPWPAAVWPRRTGAWAHRP